MSALNFASENRTTVIVAGGAVLIAGALGFILTHSARPEPAPPPPPVTMVIIQPPKPPPPPPPLQKTITPPKMTTPTMKPITPTQTPPKAPSQSHVGTSIHGNGPNAFDLSGTPGGMGFGDGDGGGSALSYFEGVIGAQIRDALQNNPITRKASAGLQIYLWLDASGTVTQVQLMKSSGNPNVDDAVTNQVLPGMRLTQLPPPGTPMPIQISLTGEQPLQ